MKIDKHISDLLFDYDCVVVPQLGGFVTNYRPAQFDEKSGMSHPAGKDIRFNKNLTKSDGLLEKALAEATSINFEEAGIMLKGEVESCWSKLNGGEKLKFNKIGVLYIDDHKNLRFEPSSDQNYLKGTFGFESFALPPVKKVIQSPAIIQEIETEEAVIIDIAEPRKSRGIYWVAAATILPFMAMSMYVGMTSNFKSPTELTVAELNPFAFSKMEPGQYEPAQIGEEVIDGNESAITYPSGESVFPYSFEKSAIDSTGVWIDLREKTAAAEALVGTYHIIAGCFGDQANADTFVNKLKGHGYEAAVLDKHKNLYRVKIESFQSYEKAISSLDNIRSTGIFPSAWLLKKPVL